MVFLILFFLPTNLYGQDVDKTGFYQRPFLALESGGHTDQVRAMDVDAAGRYAVTASYDKTVRIWLAEDGRLIRTIRVPAGPADVGRLNAVAISPDGTTIVTGNWAPGAFSLFTYEVATGRQTARIELPVNVITLAFSHDGTTIAATLGGSTAKAWSLHFYRARDLKKIAADDAYTASIYGVAFARNGRVASVSDDGKLRLYGRNLKLENTVTVPGGGIPRGVAFSSDNKFIALGYSDRPNVVVIDSRTLSKVFEPSVEAQGGRLNVVAWAADENIVYAGGAVKRGNDGVVYAWKLGIQEPFRIFLQGDDNTTAAVRGVARGELVVASMRPTITWFDRAGDRRWQVDPRNTDVRRLANLGVSSDGKKILFHTEGGNAPDMLFDVFARKYAPISSPESELTFPKIDGLPITGWKNTQTPKLNGVQVALNPGEISRALAITRDGLSFWIGGDWSLRHFDDGGILKRKIPMTTGVRRLNLAADDRLVIAALTDGTVRWYLSADGQEVLAFYADVDGSRWIAWTPLGYYAASPGAEELILWQINRGFNQEPVTYSASRFRDKFYRPDVIERILDTLDPTKALEVADQQAGIRTIHKSIAEDAPPRVAIIDPADATFASQPDLIVAYDVQDRPSTLIKRIRLLMDGRVVAQEFNRPIPESGRLAGEFKIQLQGELPVLTLLAESERGTSDPASVRLRRDAAADIYKPILYVLGIGVGKFQNHAHLKLSFASDDATDFLARLEKQEGGLYRRVVPQLLVDEQASGNAILNGLEWLERSMTDRDVAVIFFSTHGANDGDRNFYLLPHDVDVRDDIRLRRTGVRYSDVRATLSKLAERGKTLLFLDACHSGNVIAGAKGEIPDVDKVASDLASTENGVIVFSSSSAKELSVERPDLRHGVFTAALLEAFDGKSDLPPPWLRVSDLNVWLSERVKVLTNGAQTPKTTVPGERFFNPRIFRVQQ